MTETETELNEKARRVREYVAKTVVLALENSSATLGEFHTYFHTCTDADPDEPVMYAIVDGTIVDVFVRLAPNTAESP